LSGDVRFGSEADVGTTSSIVRFVPIAEICPLVVDHLSKPRLACERGGLVVTRGDFCAVHFKPYGQPQLILSRLALGAASRLSTEDGPDELRTRP
jgi:hypothetical protein